MAAEPVAVSSTPTKLWGAPTARPRSQLLALRQAPARSDFRAWHATAGAHPRRTRLVSLGSSSVESDRLVRLAVKLVSLAELRNNWDSYGAPPPSRPALRKAFEAMLATREILLPETVLPSVEGGVTLVYSTDSRAYAELEFTNDGEVVAAFKRATERPKVWSVSGDRGIAAAVTELRRLLGLSSGA